ncbi:hypothetical protein [Vogesella sp. EB]|uniref:hypothetical protein n=1 Tax=Vogesella sp. EB TaxID=1526735 RepID=UPI0012E01FFD|nr:hypothetical protein [Vogesella sp. EB]
MSDDVKSAWDASFKLYAYLWRKSYRLGCVRKDGHLDPNVILRKMIDIELSLCSIAVNLGVSAYEEMLKKLSIFNDTTVNELEKSFERLTK